MSGSTRLDELEGCVAIVGMAGRFPKAQNAREFWNNIRDGVDCISHFSAKDLEVPDPAARLEQGSYVAARSVLEDSDRFDAAFFGILPSEAELIDPQHRVFLEICWEALEDAGYVPQSYSGSIGVYAGCSASSYFLRNVCQDRAFIDDFTEAYQVGKYTTLLGMLPDCLATRVSYKLGLTGPSMTLQTACSTSLVAVCQAAQSLLNYQCDMALAGGVSITFPQKRGAHYQEGGMISPDGRCRAFDAKANGTVFGSGAGVVVLKRIEDAAPDGDHIYAVVRGFAINNDGATKIGYTAPSSDGQAKVIATAQAMAGVPADSITYLEAHGTGTPLGDPIEFAALDRVFRAETAARGFCALGSVKRNIGHLDVAAGVAGLINAAHALAHRQLPPALHYESPNEKIDLASSPFYVNSALKRWERNGSPRRAGVSAFGVGGTNAHVILEEAPHRPKDSSDNRPQLLLLSARSPAALNRASRNLAEHLRTQPNQELRDVAYTLQVGRRRLKFRRAVVAKDIQDAISQLEVQAPTYITVDEHQPKEPAVIFMFPGQGAQHHRMTSGVYLADEGFRADLDRCAEILEPHLGLDLRQALFARDDADSDLRQTWLAQPALFAVDYSLARLWMRWGLKPSAMIGHSVGEFVAACLAGVFSLEDGLAMTAARGRLMQDLPKGAMLSVRLAEADLLPMLNGELSLAAANSPALSVVSGPDAAIDRLDAELSHRGIPTRRLATSHAFHSSMVDAIVGPLTDLMRKFRFHEPSIPYISCVSGTWITPAQASDPAYWAQHCRKPVQFAEGIRSVLPSAGGGVLLEVGPGKALTTLGRQNLDRDSDVSVVSSMAESSDGHCDQSSLLLAAGTLWTRGIELDWAMLHSSPPHRCTLPTYPFERERFWIEREAPLPVPAPIQLPVDVAVSDKPASLYRETRSMHELTPQAHVASRTERLGESLATLFERLAGLSIAKSDRGLNFIELGFDSLFLTQVSQALHAEFGVKIAFRRLLDDLSTIDALAAHLHAELPEAAFAETPITSSAPVMEVAQLPASASVVAVKPATEASAAAVPPSSMEAIIREQLQTMSDLMARQLEALRGVLPVAAPTTATAVLPIPAPASIPGTTHSDDSSETPRFTPYRPIQRNAADKLTDQQSRYLKELIERYTARTAGSKRLTQAHRRTFADPRVAAGFRPQWKEMVYPLVVQKSRGSLIWDVDGNEYIDILNGYGPILLGHAPDFVVEAVQDQLEAGFEIGPLTPLAGLVADLICELTGMERASFCGTGSEAVMAALRLARTVTGRSRIVLFAGSYHGNFDEVLVKSGMRGATNRSLAAAPGIAQEMVANATVLEYGSARALEFIRAHANELAAVLVEPVQSRHPALQPVEFLREVRAITAASETALIFDEVVTGFRCHPGGAQALFGIRADLATYGKVVGGGLPIGVIAGSARFMDALDGGTWQFGDETCPEAGVTFFAGTFFRHPLALAASLAVLRHLKERGPDLQSDLNKKTAHLVSGLNGFLESTAVPVRIEHFSSLFYFSFPADLRFGSLLYYHLREKGVHIQEGYPCFVSTAHTDEQLERVAQAFRESILEMQQGRVLPGPPITTPYPVAQETPCEVDLTPSQLEILLSAQLDNEASCAFNESFTLHLRGSLDQTALITALQATVDRHDALRATFDTKRAIQRIGDHVTVDVPLIDLSSKPAHEQTASFRRFVDEDASTVFDLDAGPLIRATLVRFETERHALVVTAHHIVCDGWSANVLLDELGQFYNAARGASPSPASAPARFVDYVTKQEAWLRSAEQSTVEAYWVEKFTRPIPLLALPIDRPRGAVKSSRGATMRRTIDRATYQQARKAGARKGCTPFATLLAIFEILIHRLSGQADFAVGIPAAGQAQLDGEPLVGHCVNFLPLRTTFEDAPTVATALHRAKVQLLEAYEHQDYTYGSLVRKLGIARDPSRLPLVEVQFNLERLGARLDLAGLESEVDPNPKQFVNFDLFLNVVESDDGLILDCDYNRDLFDAETINRWLGHYESLLRGVANGMDQSVAAVPMLEPSERHRLLSEWNATSVDYPRDKCVHQLFEEQVARDPQAVAVICEESQLSYAELEAKANKLARQLRAMGVKPDKPVAIFMDRGPEMIVAALGILKAGGCYVPLDPAYPPERIAAVVEDARPAVIVTQRSLSIELPQLNARLILIDDSAVVQPGPELPPTLHAKPENLAYLIYTSGSTGRPKGVEVPHRSVVNFLGSMARCPGLSRDDILLAVTTFSFDIAVLELFLPLIVGGTVVLAPREATIDGHALLALLKRSQATVMQATPATWRLLFEAGWDGTPGFKALCGGEAFPRDLADDLVSRAESVWNMYGPTETTVWSSVLRVTPGASPVPIGPPIANTTLYILDSRGEPVPVGVPGELFIGGSGVARGYANLPGETAKKFVPDPFDDTPGARLYRTGDLVRYRPDRTMEFLGRLDTQVKLRGFRIEVGEVELVLERHPGVQACIVAVREFGPRDKRLVAYYVPNATSPSPSELRAWIAEKLPYYMVPTVFHAIDDIPRTPNGKVNRTALPEPTNAVLDDVASYVAPSNDREQALAEICAEVLGMDRLSVNLSLFDAGADSLHMFQMVARAQDRGMNLSIKHILTHRTIKAICNEIQASGGMPSNSAGPQITRVARDQYRGKRTLFASNRDT
jgi:amino acid adenylation domain-containing protein